MSFMDRFDGKGKWPFHPWIGLWIWAAFAFLFSIARRLMGFQQNWSASLALFGAVMACLGIFTIARPVIRAGGYKPWLLKSREIGGAPYVLDQKTLREAQEDEKDALAVNIVGPALAIVGTILNGASGFFS